MDAESEVVVGVDLGNTNSAVAVCRDGFVEVLANDIGKCTTPSCFFVQDSEWQVGESALCLATSYPLNTIRNVKSILGRPYLSKGTTPLGAVATEKSLVPNVVVVKVKNADNSSTVFHPEEIAGMLLLDLKRSAELQLQCEVLKAVVAVPSYFNASQRRAVVDAGSLVGLRVSYLLNETTAAALAYAHDREEEKTVVIVDVGGGGSAVAVVKVALNEVQVLAHSGARLPGGEDFDATMMEYLKQAARELGSQDIDPRDSEILRAQWTRVKEALSRNVRATINVFLPGVGKQFTYDVRRSDFEVACGNLFLSITNGLLRTLARAEVEPGSIDEVLLVGGSGRIPHLRKLVQEVLQGRQPCRAINADDAVVKGAALYAAKVVKLKQEVLSLHTRITTCEEQTFFPANTKLTFGKRLSGGVIEVQQEAEAGRMTTVFQGDPKLAHGIGFSFSGTVKFLDSASQIVEVCLDGCLPVTDHVFLSEKIGKLKKKEEDMEYRRLQGLNLLRDLLGCVCATEIPDDRFHDDAASFRTECENKLQWLDENAHQPQEEYDAIRTQTNRAWKELTAKREVERKRVEAREALRQTLQAVSDAEIPDDPLRTRAVILQLRCMGRLTWLSDHPDVSVEEYNLTHNSIISALDSLKRDRRQHASEKARIALEAQIGQILQFVRERSGDTVFDSHHRRLMKLCQDEIEWLWSAQCATADEEELVERSALFERKVESIMDEINSQLQRVEDQRVQALKAAEMKIIQALHFEVPPAHDPLFDDTKAFFDSCTNNLTWLKEHGDAPKERYDQLAATVNGAVTELLRKRALEAERLHALRALENALDKGLQEFGDHPRLVRLGQWLREGLRAARPGVSTECLEQALSRVADALRGLREARDHQLRQEEAARSAVAARQQADDSLTSLLTELGCPEPAHTVPAGGEALQGSLEGAEPAAAVVGGDSAKERQRQTGDSPPLQLNGSRRVDPEGGGDGVTNGQQGAVASPVPVRARCGVAVFFPDTDKDTTVQLRDPKFRRHSDPTGARQKRTRRPGPPSSKN